MHLYGLWHDQPTDCSQIIPFLGNTIAIEGVLSLRGLIPQSHSILGNEQFRTFASHKMSGFQIWRIGGNGSQ
jgi:hypothetical protein